MELAFTATVLTLIVAYPVGYFLAKTKSLRTLIIGIIISPFFVNTLVRLYGWIAILSDEGFLNNTLLQLHIITEPLKLLYNLPAVIIGIVELNSTIMIFSIYSVVAGMDPSLEEAALVLGAGRIQKFFRITFPLTLPGIISGTAITFGTNMGAFLQPLFLGGGRVVTLGTLVYNNVILTFNWPAGAMVAIVIVAVTLPITFIYLRVIKSSKMTRRLR